MISLEPLYPKAEMPENVKFSDIFLLEDIQNLQDLFAETHGVASVITDCNGVPITNSSNFTRLCLDIIRKTEKGCANCFKSDAMLGRHCPSGPTIQFCLSAGLLDAGASITVGGHHIANWLIGQVRNDKVDEQQIMKYADQIGANRKEFWEAFLEVPVMSDEQFDKVAKMLFVFANQLSEMAYTNLQLKMQIADREKATILLKENENKYRVLVDNSFEGIVIINLEGHVLFANRAIIKTFEYETLDQIIGQNIFNHIAPEYIAQTIEDFAKVVQGIDAGVAESCGITSKGKRIWMESVGKIIEYDGIKADLISVRDITEKKHAEDRLNKLNDCFLKFNSDSIANINLLVALCGELLGATCALYNCIQDNMLCSIGKWNTPEDYQSVDFPDGHLCNDVINSSDDNICIVRNLEDTQYVISDPNVKRYNLKTYIGKAVKFDRRNVGSLCVLFQQDIVLSPASKHILELIASAIGVEEDRNRAAGSLTESEEKYRKTFYISPDSVNINRLNDGMFVSVNNGFTKIMGYTEEETIGKTSIDINIWVNPEDRRTLVNGLEKDGLFENLEAEFRKKNGEIVIGLMSASVVLLNGVQHIISITRDITDRKIAEEALRESEAKYKAIVTYSASWEAWYSTEGKLIWMNPYSIHLTGYTPEEYMSADDYWAMVFAPEDISLANEVLKEAMNGSSGDNLEFRCLRKDGSKLWVSVSWRPILDVNGHTLGFRTSAFDITERKQTFMELKKLRKAIDSSGEAIFLTDKEGIFTFANPGFTETYGYTAEEIVGKQTPRILKSGLLSDEVYTHFWNTILSGQEIKGEIKNKRKDGAIIDADGSANAIFDEDLNIIGYLGIQRDITGRKQAEEELIVAKEKAEESDRLKSAFLANMSHEIRTPMNGILGFSELLKEPDLTGELKLEYIGIIEKSGARMLNIINDIIDLSKIESGQMKVNLSETNINEQIEFVLSFFRPEAEQKGLELLCNCYLSADMAVVRTDKEKFYAVLFNLIKNALKFTTKGSIEISCSIDGSTSSLTNVSEVTFCIKDTGIGILNEKKDVIFERFRQGSESLTRDYEGAGLGLAISKAYVKMLGGNIWVESEPGKGSAFYVKLPLTLIKEKVSGNSNPDTIKLHQKQENNLKILIAEDDEGSAKLLTINLKSVCREVLKTKTGRHAVEICYTNPDIDLVLMDIEMPEMNGYEATKQIRKFNTQVVIIAQTAFAMGGDREKAIEAGCNDYISKPIRREHLLEMIHNYFKK